MFIFFLTEHFLVKKGKTPFLLGKTRSLWKNYSSHSLVCNEMQLCFPTTFKFTKTSLCNHVENTAGSVPENFRNECCISTPSTLFILVSIVMIFSLKFKVSHIQNEYCRYSHRLACAVHSFNCNLCPGFSRECLT